MAESESDPSLHKQVDTPSPQNIANRESAISKQVIANVPPSPNHQHESCKCRPDQTPRWKIILEVGAICVGLALGLIYWNQLCEMRTSNAITTKALTNSVEQFRIDERGWVVIDGIDKTAVPVPAGSANFFKYRIWPKNVGKTVARNVRIFVSDTLDAGMLWSNENGIRMTQDQLFHENNDSNKRVFIPDKPGPQTLAPSERSVIPIDTSGNAPYKGQFHYVIGRIDYVDAFNVSHWTHFCFVISTDGELIHCQYGNDEDTNPEPKAP